MSTNHVQVPGSRFNEVLGSALTAVVLVMFSVISIASIVHF
jgi:hypothetical protein